MSVFSVAALRQALLALPKQPRESDSEGLDICYFYAPLSHAKALHPDNMLVEGVHGVGKSEWFLQLSNPDHLQAIAAILSRSGLENTECSVGFGQVSSPNHPSKRSLSNLLECHDAQTIWDTVIALGILNEFYYVDGWSKAIQKYKNDVDNYDNRLRQRDHELVDENKKHIVLFDALDYAADDWQILKTLLKGLCQAALKFRAFRAIRLKIFVRPDMLADPSVFAFTGGSKVISSKLTLEWQKVELFNLLWQYLANSPEGGEAFRKGCEQAFGQSWHQHPDADSWLIPDAMRRDEALQRKIFHALTGEWMGDSAKSGYPYAWLPTHLEDGFGKVSPCSFLAALQAAAASAELPEDDRYPLNAQALKKGVQQASQMQVRTLNERYHWINDLLKGKELSFPCDFGDIEDSWRSNDARSKLEKTISVSGAIPPPSYSESDFSYEGLKQDLIALGIFQPMLDGRINMPDVYRVGYGLRRKGGVMPVK